MAKKYIDADLLNAEIETRKSIAQKFIPNKLKAKERRYFEGKIDAYNDILPLIDSLQQEQPSEDLEEAAEKYLDMMFGKGKHQSFYKELFIAGAEWQKQQMLKDTVEGEVCKDHIVTEKPFYFYQSRLIELPDNLKEGDKVKIVIIPDKEEKK